jgi:hypothetical protein
VARLHGVQEAESFNGRLRDECLNVKRFLRLVDVREKLESRAMTTIPCVTLARRAACLRQNSPGEPCGAQQKLRPPAKNQPSRCLGSRRPFAIMIQTEPKGGSKKPIRSEVSRRGIDRGSIRFK